MHVRRRGRTNRRGVEVLELILVLPVLILVLVVTFQFATVLMFRSTVTHAATVGAREAGKGAEFDKVVDAVQQVLGVNCITVSDAPGSGTKVVLEDGDGIVDDEFGDPSLDCPLPCNDLDPLQVRVTVCVDLPATSFCDVLASCGISFLGRGPLRASSMVLKEYEQDLGVP